MRVRVLALEAGPVVARWELLIPALGPELRQVRPRVRRHLAVILAEYRDLEARRNLGLRAVLENRPWELNGDPYPLLQQSHLTAALLPRLPRETHKALAAI